MCVSAEVKQFFEHVIRGYIKSDIQDLLTINRGAGPILAVTMNGIDAMGGIIYGFQKGSRQRSVDFMIKYMGIKEPIANFLYEYARCGMVHEGTVKSDSKSNIKRVIFGAGKPADGTDLPICRKGIDLISVEVYPLALSFLKAIDAIYDCGRNDLKHLPDFPKEEVFDNAYDSLPDSPPFSEEGHSGYSVYKSENDNGYSGGYWKPTKKKT